MEIINTALLPILQGFRIGFYLNGINKKGVGTIYATFYIQARRYRVSTGIKIEQQYWDRQSNTLTPRGSRPLDWRMFQYYSQMLNELLDEVETAREGYLCRPENPVSPERVGAEFSRIINKHRSTMTKQAQPKKLLPLMRGLAMETDNKLSENAQLAWVKMFERFITETALPDEIQTLNMNTARKYREWLVKSDYAIKTIQSGWGYLFTLVKKLEQKHGYDFGMDKGKFEPIKDKRDREAKRVSRVALTEDEVNLLANFAVPDKKLQHARDMFLLQCYTGVRVEDLPLLLRAENIKTNGEGVTYCQFKTQKTGTTVIIPLNTIYPAALTLVNAYLDNCPVSDRTRQRDYNYTLKEIAKQAGLNRVIVKTEQTGTKVKQKSKPIYELITSHAGRRTFITNCQRYKGMTPSEVSIMTGHADETMITQVYTNKTHEDDLRTLNKAYERTTEKQHPAEIQPKEESPLAKSVNTDNNDPVVFAKWLLSVLDIPVKNELSLPVIVDEIAKRKKKIISDYGEQRYEQIKTFLGLGLTDEGKQRLNVLFCQGLNRKIKLRFVGFKQKFHKL